MNKFELDHRLTQIPLSILLAYLDLNDLLVIREINSMMENEVYHCIFRRFEYYRPS